MINHLDAFVNYYLGKRRAGEGTENNRKEKAGQERQSCAKSQKGRDKKAIQGRAERKTCRQFLKKPNEEFPWDPVTPLLGIDPKELNAGTLTILGHHCSEPHCSQWPSSGEMPKCHAADKCITTMRPVHTMDTIWPPKGGNF